MTAALDTPRPVGDGPTTSATSDRSLSRRLKKLGSTVRSAPFLLRLGLSAVLFVTILTPFIRLLDRSFRSGDGITGGDLTLDQYERSLRGTGIGELFLNTLIFATGGTIVPLIIGTVLAWLVTRTDMPGRGMWETMTLALYFIPMLAAGTAWVILLSPRTGVINVVIREITPFDGFSANSLPGMIFIQSIYLVPLVFLLTGASFRAVNPELEEAARIGGARPWSAFLRVTLGVARPAVASAGMLCFIVGLGSLEVPLLFGYPGRIYLLTTDVYTALRVRFPSEYGRAAAISVLLMLMALTVLWLYVRITRQAHRFVTVGGRTGRQLVTRLGPWRWLCFAGCSLFFIIALILPLASVIIGSLLPFIGKPSTELLGKASLDNYRQLADNPVIWRALRNSITLAVTVGLTVSVAGTMIAYFVVRMRSRWSRTLDLIATLPLTVPAIVLAAGLLFSYISVEIPGIGKIYGSLWIMAVAYFAYFIPIAVRQMSGPMHQISPDLEHAARISGASTIATLRRVVVPLLLPAMGGTFLLAFITFLREFVNSVLLSDFGTEVISTVMYSYYSNGSLPTVAAIAVVMSAAVFLVILLLRKVFKIKIAF